MIFGTSALCYFDTSSLAARAYHPWGRTYANDEHAELILDLGRHIDSGGEIPEQATGHQEVLVLSHYRGQTAQLRRRLACYRDRGVSASTVHRSQGSEATTCIFDLTLTPHQPAWSSSVLTAVRPLDEGSRLLAVAVSRARSRFVFVGDVSWRARSIPAYTVLGRLYAALREHGHEIMLGDLR